MQLKHISTLVPSQLKQMKKKMNKEYDFHSTNAIENKSDIKNTPKTTIKQRAEDYFQGEEKKQKETLLKTQISKPSKKISLINEDLGLMDIATEKKPPIYPRTVAKSASRDRLSSEVLKSIPRLTPNDATIEEILDDQSLMAQYKALVQVVQIENDVLKKENNMLRKQKIELEEQFNAKPRSREYSEWIQFQMDKSIRIGSKIEELKISLLEHQQLLDDSKFYFDELQNLTYQYSGIRTSEIATIIEEIEMFLKTLQNAISFSWPQEVIVQLDELIRDLIDDDIKKIHEGSCREIKQLKLQVGELQAEKALNDKYRSKFEELQRQHESHQVSEADQSQLESLELELSKQTAKYNQLQSEHSLCASEIKKQSMEIQVLNEKLQYFSLSPEFLEAIRSLMCTIYTGEISSTQSILLQSRGAGVLIKTAEHLQNKQINIMKDMKLIIQSIEAIMTAVTGTHKDYSFILADVITLCELLRDSETGSVSRVKFNLAVTKIIRQLPKSKYEVLQKALGVIQEGQSNLGKMKQKYIGMEGFFQEDPPAVEEDNDLLYMKSLLETSKSMTQALKAGKSKEFTGEPARKTIRIPNCGTTEQMCRFLSSVCGTIEELLGN